MEALQVDLLGLNVQQNTPIDSVTDQYLFWHLLNVIILYKMYTKCGWTQNMLTLHLNCHTFYNCVCEQSCNLLCIQSLLYSTDGTLSWIQKKSLKKGSVSSKFSPCEKLPEVSHSDTGWILGWRACYLWKHSLFSLIRAGPLPFPSIQNSFHT